MPIADRIKNNGIIAEKCTDLQKTIGKSGCRVVLHLTALEKRGFEKKKFASFQCIADEFVLEMKIFTNDALELKFGGIYKADDDTSAGTKLEVHVVDGQRRLVGFD